MIKLEKLIKYLDVDLEMNNIPEDSSNNGLQVEGKEEIKKIIFAVDGCLALAKIAAKENGDFIFVHHGLSWGDGFKRLTGHSAEIFSTLFKNGISLYGAHLPLDAHPEIGHNAQIAKKLKFEKISTFAKYAGTEIGVKGEFYQPILVAELAEKINSEFNTHSKIFGNNSCEIRKVGVISGGAGTSGIEDAIDAKVDCLITGEVGHSSWHLIQDSGISVISAGHYCTEVPGVLAVMKKIEDKFDVKCEFIDLPTGL